jgi:hypothetical protein
MITKLPKLPNSIANWFEREYGEFSHHHYCIKEKSESLENVNPYHVIIVYQDEPDFYRVLGFMQMGQIVQYIPIKKIKSFTNYEGCYQIPWIHSATRLELSLHELYRQLERAILHHQFDNLNICIFFILIQYNEELYQLLLPHLERQFFSEMEFITESSDDSIRKWLQRIQEFYILQFVIEPTLLDLNLFPNEPMEPTLWFMVKMIDLPTHISDQLPLYKGGMMHLPRKYLHHWIWRKALTFDYKKVADLPEQLGYLEKAARQLFQEKKKKSTITASVSIEIADIEDLFPPCIEKIIKSDKFPKDIPRNALVRTLAQVNYPLEKIGKILDEKNEKDPHERRVLKDSQSRWDYKSVYEKKYAPVPCSLDICACPGESLEKKRLACFNRFKEKFPDRQMKKMWGPLDWLKSEKIK